MENPENRHRRLFESGAVAVPLSRHNNSGHFGYTATVIAHRGVLDEGVNFIQKPISIKDLAVKVRDAIEET